MGRRPAKRGRLLRALGKAALLPLGLWSFLAILLTGANTTEIASTRWAVGIILAAGILFAIWKLNLAKTAAVVFAGFGTVLLWWWSFEPSNEREWNPDQRRTAWAEIDGSKVTLHDIRNFRYESTSSWKEDWYDATFDTDELEGTDFFIVQFSKLKGPAHTMISFRFAGERFITFSAEIRKEAGESYGIVRGLFRQYELMYVVGDERDLLQLRTNHRGDQVHLYQGKGSHEKQAAYFLDMVQRLNELYERPEFYNTLVNNCTTNLVLHWEKINARKLPRDHRIVLPGYMDDLVYEYDLAKTYGTLEETRERTNISARAIESGGREDFSLRVRDGLGADG